MALTQPNNKVIINGNVLLYEAKAPYVLSGQSLKGVLEYDPDEDKVMCHECGKWFSDLAVHIFNSHEMKSDDYKKAHGLQPGTALVCERIRLNRISVGKRRYPELIAAGKLAAGAKKQTRGQKRRHKRATRVRMNSEEFQNARRICPAQLLERIKKCAQAVGHTPTQQELRAHGLSDKTIVHRFGTMKKAMQLAGLMPRLANSERKYSRSLLISMIRSFAEKHGRLPARSDSRRGFFPADGIFTRCFGSWSKAIEAAGFESFTRGRGQLRRRGAPQPEARKPVQIRRKASIAYA